MVQPKMFRLLFARYERSQEVFRGHHHLVKKSYHQYYTIRQYLFQINGTGIQTSQVLTMSQTKSPTLVILNFRGHKTKFKLLKLKFLAFTSFLWTKKYTAPGSNPCMYAHLSGHWLKLNLNHMNTGFFIYRINSRSQHTSFHIVRKRCKNTMKNDQKSKPHKTCTCWCIQQICAIVLPKQYRYLRRIVANDGLSTFVWEGGRGILVISVPLNNFYASWFRNEPSQKENAHYCRSFL